MGIKTDPCDPLAWWRADPFAIQEEELIQNEEGVNEGMEIEARPRQERIGFDGGTNEVLHITIFLI